MKMIVLKTMTDRIIGCLGLPKDTPMEAVHRVAKEYRAGANRLGFKAYGYIIVKAHIATSEEEAMKLISGSEEEAKRSIVTIGGPSR